MIGGDVFSRIRPLRVAAGRQGEDCQAQQPAIYDRAIRDGELHGASQAFILYPDGE